MTTSMSTITTTGTITAMDESARRDTDFPLSPCGRGRRPEGAAGEGKCAQIETPEPPHPDPLPQGERGFAAPHGTAELNLETPALYRLMAWLSPAYPIGAFSYSSGIEWAVEAGDIKDAQTLRQWLTAMMADGSGFADAVFFVHAFRAVAAGDDAALHATAELAAAFVSSKERFLETTAQGRAFLDVTRAAWPCTALDRLGTAWSGPVALPIAVGTTCAGHGIACEAALNAFLHAIAANWISAGVRLIPLGQTDGQRVLAALEKVVAATAARARQTPLDEVGTATFRADLAGMRHESQYTRLFRS